MRNKKILLAIGFGVLAAAHLLTGCSETKKIERAKHTLKEHKLEAASLCGELFPITPSTVYINGKTIYDTIYAPFIITDTFACPPSDTIVKYKIDVQTKLQKVIERRVDTVVKEIPDLYKIAELDEQLKTTDEKNNKLTAKIERKNKFILWLLIIVIIETAWILRKPILRLLLPVIPTV